MTSFTESYDAKTQKSGYTMTIGGVDYFMTGENVVVYKIRPDGKIINAARNEITSGSTIYYFL